MLSPMQHQLQSSNLWRLTCVECTISDLFCAQSTVASRLHHGSRHHWCHPSGLVNEEEVKVTVMTAKRSNKLGQLRQRLLVEVSRSCPRSWPRSTSTTAASSFWCAHRRLRQRHVQGWFFFFALCSLWLQTGPDARHHGRMDSKGPVTPLVSGRHLFYLVLA